MAYGDLMARREEREKSATMAALRERFVPKGYRILSSNWGYVAAPPPGTLPAIKLFDDASVRDREADNYAWAAARGLPVPTYQRIAGAFVAAGERLWTARVGNVRGARAAFRSFREAGEARVADLIARFHRDGPGGARIHGNVHPSNFFELADGTLGVFDLADARPGRTEPDLARVALDCEGRCAGFLAAYRAAGGVWDQETLRAAFLRACAEESARARKNSDAVRAGRFAQAARLARAPEWGRA